jgi:hypothetical protein
MCAPLHWGLVESWAARRVRQAGVDMVSEVCGRTFRVADMSQMADTKRRHTLASMAVLLYISK